MLLCTFNDRAEAGKYKRQFVFPVDDFSPWTTFYLSIWPLLVFPFNSII